MNLEEENAGEFRFHNAQCENTCIRILEMNHTRSTESSRKSTRPWVTAATMLALMAQALAANANCPSDCESRLQLCLKEAKTDAIRDKCKVYFKGCLKTCSQGK